MATSLRTSALPVRCTQTGLLRNLVLIIAVLAAGRSLAGEDAMPPEDPEGRKEAVAAETREQEVYVGGNDDILRALEQAAALEREENWPEAAALYRSIIEKHLDHIASTMVSASADRTRGELYITAAEQSRRRLLAFPADARAALEARHGQAAQAAADRALAGRDAAALQDIALRFAGTDAALAALDALGDIRFERGDAASAAQAWEELLQSLPAGSGQRAPATVKLAHARSALGEAAAARDLIDSIPLRTEVVLGGRKIAADTLKDSLPGPQPALGAAEWPAIAGNAACNAFPGRVFDVGRRLWTWAALTAAVQPAPAEAEPKGAAELPRAAPALFPAIHHPIVADGRVWINTGVSIDCLDVATGAALWTFAGERFRTGTRDLAGGGSMAGGTLFATVGGWLAAIDRTSGEVRWQANAQADPLFGRDAKRMPEVVLSQPAVARGRVFVGATTIRPEGESFLLALDGRTGALAAKLFIASHSRPRYLGLGALGSPPAVQGGTVVYCTNAGAVAAVDAESLQLRWAWTYPRWSPELKAHRVDAGSRWAVNPPVIVGAMAIVAPQDSNWLCALDLSSGRLLWRQPRRGARWFAAPEGLGVAFAFGRTVSAISTATGKLLWTADVAGEPAGRPVAGADALLVPTDAALCRLDAKTGAVLSRTAWGEPGQAGNLCIAEERLIIGTRTGAAAFESWEKSAAEAPAPTPADLLALGRLHLGRNEPDLAFPHLRKAADLLVDDQPLKAEVSDALAKACERLALDRQKDDPADALEWFQAALAATKGPDKARLLIAAAELQAGRGLGAEAVELYQQVIAEHPDDLFPAAPGFSVRASLQASKRIDELIAAHGEAVYAAQERAAGQSMEMAAGLVAEYERIVNLYPNSAAAVDAAVKAAKSRADGGTPDAAAEFLLHAAEILPARSRPALLLRGADTLDVAGRADLARVLLIQAMEDHPDAFAPDGSPVAEFCKGKLEGQPPARGQDDLFVPTIRERWRSPVRLSSAPPKIFDNPSDCCVDTPFGPRRPCYIVHSDAPVWAIGIGPERRGRYDYIECRSAREGYLAWARAVPSWEGEALFAGDRVILARPKSVLALNAVTGATVWRFDSGARETDFLAFSGVAAEPGPPGGAGKAYVCSSAGRLVCLNAADGEVAWDCKIDGAFILRNGVYALDNFVAVFSEFPAALHGFDKETGRKTLTVPFEFQNKRISGRPLHIAASKKIVVPLSDGLLVAVDAATGQHLWERDAGFSVGSLKADPAGKCVVVLPDNWAVNGKLQVLNADNGEVQWERDIPRDSLFDAAVNNRGVFLLQASGRTQHLQGLSLAAGERLFEDYLSRMVDLCAIGLCGDFVVLSGRQAVPRVVVLNRRGVQVFSAEPGGVEHLAASVVGGTLVVATDRSTYGYGRVDGAAASMAAAAACAALAGTMADDARRAETMVTAAQRAFESGDPRLALDLLGRAMEAAPNDWDYLRIYDRLSGLRDGIHEAGPPVMRCLRMDRAPVIDGILADEWNEGACVRVEGPQHIEIMLPGPTQQRSIVSGSERREPSRLLGANDISMKVYSGWDDENLYIAVDVTDRTHRVTRKDTDNWQGDLLIIGIDCLNDGGYGYGWGDYILTQGLMDKPKDDKNDRDEPEGNYSVKLKEDGSGVIYESAIPWSYLREMKPYAGRRFGLGVTVTDDDGGGVAKSMSWTPGMYLHEDSSRLSKGFTPEMLGDVILTLPDGYGKNPPPPPQKDEEPQ